MTTAVATRTQESTDKSPQLFREFDRYEQAGKVIMLRPVEAVMEEHNPLFTAYASVIRWNPDTDFYPTPGKGGHKSLTKQALRRLAAAANISILGTKRKDDRRDPDYAEYEARVCMRMPDGQIRYGHASAQFRVQVILDQDEAAAKKRNRSYDRTSNENTYRRFAAQRCESLAINRAIRDLLVIQSSYSDAEVAKPFVVPVITPNMAEIMQYPEGRQMAIAQALGATNLLYPQQNAENFAPSLPQPQQNAGMLPADTSSSVGELPAAVVSPQEASMPEDPDALPELPFDDPVSELPDLSEPAETENQRTIRRLYDERKHNLSADKLKTMLDAPADKQISYIDWLTGLPMKPASKEQSGRKGTLSEAQIRRLYAIAKNAGYDGDAVHELIAKLYGGITSTDDLTRDQYNELCGDKEKGIESYLEAHPFVGGAR